MIYQDGAVYGRGMLTWVWSSIAYTCTYPCYIDRCALTGVMFMYANPPLTPGPENTPRAIDGLEFA